MGAWRNAARVRSQRNDRHLCVGLGRWSSFFSANFGILPQ
jgi:hypothetical protein